VGRSDASDNALFGRVIDLGEDEQSHLFSPTLSESFALEGAAAIVIVIKPEKTFSTR